MRGLLAKAGLDANLLDGGASGKRFATGTVTSGNDWSLTFTYADGTTQQTYYITITGLAFAPSILIAVCSTWREVVFFTPSVLYNSYPLGVLGRAQQFNGAVSQGASDLRNYKLIGPTAFSNGSITLPVSVNGQTYTWYAFE